MFFPFQEDHPQSISIAIYRERIERGSDKLMIEQSSLEIILSFLIYDVILFMHYPLSFHVHNTFFSITF